MIKACQFRKILFEKRNKMFKMVDSRENTFTSGETIFEDV